MVGRAHELARLEIALLAALRGESRVAVIAGDAGMGKSRLGAELLRQASALGALTLTGECSEVKLALPYLPLVEAIGNYLAEASATLPQLRDALGEEAGPLARLFPQLGDVRTGYGPTGTSLDTLRLFESLVSLFRLLAAPGGLLLIAEDVHWADRSTAELLDYLSRRLRQAGTLLLVTVRDPDVGREHPMHPVLQRWRRSGQGEAVTLRPLGVEDVGAMAAAIFDGEAAPPQLVHELYRRSEGLPFAVEELLRQAGELGRIGDVARDGWNGAALSGVPAPRSIAEGILGRAERLEAGQLEVMRCAAVLGRSFDFAALQQLSGQPDEALIEALDPAVDMQLVEEDPQREHGYRFRHVLIREAIYDDIIVTRRRLLHGRAADALRDTQSTTLASLPRT